jgi:hypothetical protein
MPQQLTYEYKWAHGNVHAIFAVVSWWRGFPATDCHRHWNMGVPLWTCKQVSKCGVDIHIVAQDQEIQKCAFCQESEGTLISPSILEHYQDHGQTVSNSPGYYAVLTIHSKCRMLTSRVILCHDNTRCHMASATTEWFENWNLGFFPASPDLTPSDYHFFWQLSDVLCGHWFANDEVKDTVHMWLCMQLKTFYAAGIRNSWTKVTNVWRN